MTAESALSAARDLVDVIAVLVGVGMVVERLRGRQRQAAHAQPASNYGQSQQLADLTRRIQDVEDDIKAYLLKEVANEKFDGVWHEMQNLRSLMEALRRRLEGMGV